MSKVIIQISRHRRDIILTAATQYKCYYSLSRGPQQNRAFIKQPDTKSYISSALRTQEILLLLQEPANGPFQYEYLTGLY